MFGIEKWNSVTFHVKSVTMATKREMAGYNVFFTVLGHKKFIHKILAKSESVHFQPLFNFFGALREWLLRLKVKVTFEGPDANSCRCDYLKTTEANL